MKNAASQHDYFGARNPAAILPLCSFISAIAIRAIGIIAIPNSEAGS